MSGEEEEISWILDGIVNLLSGPVWTVPILTFIEHKSITFESAREGEDEEDAANPDLEEQHQEIHGEYKRLVDYLLQSFMDDLSVDPEMLQNACQEAAAINTTFNKSLFEQLWAADDYETFNAMMIKKNLELQLQALEMLRLNYGINMRGREGQEGEEGEEEEESVKREREILEEVFRLSKEEHDQLTSLQDQESRDLEIAMARSIQDEKKRLEKALRRPKKEGEEEEEVEEEEFGKGRVLPPIRSKPTEIDEEDLKRRQEYLKEQRDRLLEMKKREREKRLENYETKEPNRPQSARAARNALDGATGVDPKTLAVRRALAERLKAEVIKEA